MNVHNTNTAFQDEIPINPPSDTPITTIYVPQQRMRISHHATLWMSTLEERFNEIVSLPVGWDGYEGRPVSFTTAKFAASMIERLYLRDTAVPSIVPGADGSMQIEWHVNDYDVELDVLGPLNVHAYRFDLVSGVEEELELESDFTRIVKWITDLSIERNFHPQNNA